MTRTEKGKEHQRRHSRARQRALAAVAQQHEAEFRRYLEVEKSREGIRTLQRRPIVVDEVSA